MLNKLFIIVFLIKISFPLSAQFICSFSSNDRSEMLINSKWRQVNGHFRPPYRLIYDSVCGWNRIKNPRMDKDTRIRFEFMHCSFKSNNFNRTLPPRIWLAQFIEEYNEKYCARNAFSPMLPHPNHWYIFSCEGENFIIERTLGYSEWYGICEFYLIWDEKNIYLMISCIEYGVTRDREILDYLFEEMRSLIVSSD